MPVKIPLPSLDPQRYDWSNPSSWIGYAPPDLLTTSGINLNDKLDKLSFSLGMEDLIQCSYSTGSGVAAAVLAPDTTIGRYRRNARCVRARTPVFSAALSIHLRLGLNKRVKLSVGKISLLVLVSGVIQASSLKSPLRSSSAELGSAPITLLSDKHRSLYANGYQPSSQGTGMDAQHQPLTGGEGMGNISLGHV